MKIFITLAGLMAVIGLIALIVVGFSGRILGQINKGRKNCTEDEPLKTAHDLSVWIVSISSVLAGLIGIGLVGMALLAFFVPTVMAF